jgi:hypothetical protein
MTDRFAQGAKKKPRPRKPLPATLSLPMRLMQLMKNRSALVQISGKGRSWRHRRLSLLRPRDHNGRRLLRRAPRQRHLDRTSRASR